MRPLGTEGFSSGEARGARGNVSAWTAARGSRGGFALSHAAAGARAAEPRGEVAAAAGGEDVTR